MYTPLSKVPPDYEGVAGKLWKYREHPDSPHHATVAAYLLWVPDAHLFWSYYMVAMVHLRERPGVPAPVKSYKNATHEFMIAALNPDKEPTVDGPAPFMLPLNFVAQVAFSSDEEAAAATSSAALDIVRGRINPDSDYAFMWRERFPAP